MLIGDPRKNALRASPDIICPRRRLPFNRLSLWGARGDRAPWMRSAKKETGPAHEITDRLGSFVSRSSRSIPRRASRYEAASSRCANTRRFRLECCLPGGSRIASRHSATVFSARTRAAFARTYCDTSCATDPCIATRFSVAMSRPADFCRALNLRKLVAWTSVKFRTCTKTARNTPCRSSRTARSRTRGRCRFRRGSGGWEKRRRDWCRRR